VIEIYNQRAMGRERAQLTELVILYVEYQGRSNPKKPVVNHELTLGASKDIGEPGENKNSELGDERGS